MQNWDSISLGVGRNANLYRFMSIGRLIELVSSKKLVFVRPELWEDPFENFLMYSRLCNMRFSDTDIRRHTQTLYCQCWTSNSESDAMWKIYSRNSDGVRIRAKAIDLMGSIVASTSIARRSGQHWIGRVKYVSQKSFLEEVQWPDRFCRSDDYFDPRNNQLVRSLLLKRRAFSHEREVRIVYHDVEASESAELMPFDIDVNEVILEITFDPRMSGKLVSAYTQVLKKLGYEGSVNQSQLYGVPTFQPMFDVFWDQLVEDARNEV